MANRLLDLSSLRVTPLGVAPSSTTKQERKMKEENYRCWLWHKDCPEGMIVEGYDEVAEKLDSGWVSNPSELESPEKSEPTSLTKPKAKTASQTKKAVNNDSTNSSEGNN